MSRAECQKTDTCETVLTEGDASSVATEPEAAPLAAEAKAGVKYAGFWRRLAAGVLDCAAVLLIGFGLSIIVPILLAPLVGLPSDLQIILSIALFWVIVPWLYWAVMESSSRQATFGKSYLDMVVTDSVGGRLSFARASARYWAKLPSCLVLFAGFLMAGFTAKKQALHDIITGCLVVVKESPDQTSNDSRDP